MRPRCARTAKSSVQIDFSFLIRGDGKHLDPAVSQLANAIDRRRIYRSHEHLGSTLRPFPELSARRGLESRVQYDGDWIPAFTGDTNIEKRVVLFQRGSTDQDGIVLIAKLVRASTGDFPGDPTRVSPVGAHSPVQRDRSLHYPEHASGSHTMNVLGIRLPGFLLEAALGHRDARLAKIRKPLPGDAGIGVLDCGDDAIDAGFEDRGDARRRSAVVGAGLERHIQRRALRVAPGLAKGMDLGVRLAGALVESLADNAALMHHDGTDDRVGRGAPARLLSQLERTMHECFVGSIHRHGVRTTQLTLRDTCS